MMNSEIKLKIPSILDNVRIVESFIDHAKDKFRINDDIYGNIMISVTESVINAIVHGNGNDKAKNVLLSLKVSQRDLNFTVSDEGRGFDYDALPDPTAPENLESTGGRGIFLIRNLADEVDFQDEGKTISIKFNMPNND
jgi:serine/threonine-protein kinase RsbW